MTPDELSRYQIDKLLRQIADGLEPSTDRITANTRFKAILRQIGSNLIRARRFARGLAWRRYNVEGPLREIKKTLQFKGLPHRRWFANSYFDLIVYDSERQIVGFDICYRQDGSSGTTFSWDKELGTTNDFGGEGESGPLKNKRPILRTESVADVFRQVAIDLPEPIPGMIFMHLQNCEFNQATATFLESLTDDERGEIRRRAEELWRQYGDREREEGLILRGEVYWLQASQSIVDAPTHEGCEVQATKEGRILSIVTSDAHRTALKRWWAAQDAGGFRYGEPFDPHQSPSGG